MSNPVKNKLSRFIFVCMSVALCPLPFVSVQAQVIEEIIVTARKREESLQDTPISIQAFTADGLEKRGIDNLSEIGSFTPNMTFDKAATIGGSNNAAIVYIRGIGQDAAIPTIDLGVGTYIDGVYLARSVGRTHQELRAQVPLEGVAPDAHQSAVRACGTAPDRRLRRRLPHAAARPAG